MKAPFNLLLRNLQIHLSSHEITSLPLNFLNGLFCFLKNFCFPEKLSPNMESILPQVPVSKTEQVNVQVNVSLEQKLFFFFKIYFFLIGG